MALIATTVGTLISQLVTVPEISAPAQLPGRRLGVVRFGTVSEFIAKLLLQSWGLEPGHDVPLVQTGGQSETVAAMQNGAVSAVVVSDLQALQLRRLGFRLLADAADLDREYVASGLAGMRSYLLEHPEAVRRFLRGVARGMARFLADKDLSTTLLQRHARIDDPDVLEGSWQVHAHRYANRGLLTSPGAIRTVQEETAGDPRMAAMTPDAIIDNRYVQELHDSGFLQRVYR